MPTPPTVDAWLRDLEHPQKDLIAALRARVLACDGSITEGIKWNSGSFRTTEWFATFNVRGKEGPKPVTLVLHLGAKVQDRSAAVPDPTGLLTWLGKDRATLTIRSVEELETIGPAFDALIRAWIAAL